MFPQRIEGNQAVQKLVKSRALQAKLRIGQPNDIYEQEADRVAEQVMSMSEPQAVSSGELSIQRTYPRCEEEKLRRQPEEEEKEKEELLQTKEISGQNAETTPYIESRINAIRGGGQPMAESERAFFEPRFGYDFGKVRVHTDSKAAEAARAVNARAFTVGQDVLFGTGQYVPETSDGQRLMAHELAHVFQQRPPVGHILLRDQRRASPQEPVWLPELGEILPGRVGLLTDIDRVTMLIDIFGTELLEQHVRLIHNDAVATRFTRNHGVLGVVALYDTRRGNQLNVVAAGQALTNLPDRYRRDSLERLRLRPSSEVPPSFWFQDPTGQRRGVGEGGRPTTTSEQRSQVHIQPDLGQVTVEQFGDVFVRFAYPETEVSRTGASPRIERAKNSILQAIGRVMGDIYALPPAASQAERREQETVRARLHETLRSLSRSSPLNVYIATLPSHQELLTGQVAAFTDRVNVNLQDAGDPARLEAAIRMPLLTLQGGGLPTLRGVQPIPAASPEDLQRILLHEALHALLIRQSSDANAIWETNRAQLTVQGSPSANPKFVELVRKYLIAQEEVFVYENEGGLYPPVSSEKARYDSFITNVQQRFFSRRQLTLNAMSRSIPVSQRVARQALSWTITYQVPSGIVDLTVNDIPFIDLLLGSYPLR